MDTQKEIKELRESTGMNRREFSDYYGIPYRTVQDWEAGKRKMPDYVLRLMKYMAEIERINRVDRAIDEAENEMEEGAEPIPLKDAREKFNSRTKN